MRLPARSLPLILSVALLGGASLPSTAVAASAVQRKLDRARTFEESLTGDEKKQKLRHNLEKLAKLWAAAKVKAKGDDRREALEGELRAWTLIARWSGKASDRNKVAELTKALGGPTELAKKDRGAKEGRDRAAKAAKDRDGSDARDAKEARASKDVKVAKERRDAKDAKGGAKDARASKDDDGRGKASDAADAEAAHHDELLRIVQDVRGAFPELADEGTPAIPEGEDGRDDSVARNEPDVTVTAEDAPLVLKGSADPITLPEGTKLKRSTRDAARSRDGSFVRIRRIVVDAGHGGKDVGAIGRGGIREKDVNLAIATELGRQLERRLGVKVIYTRTTDEYVSLEKRSQIANASSGDLFVSIHANSHKKRKINGIETYYLNTTSDRYATRLAKRENLGEDDDDDGEEPEPTVGMPADEQAELPSGALGQDLRLILADLAMRSATVESRRLAGYVQTTLVGKLKRQYDDVQDLGVKHALFAVLLGVRMPSILIETGFVSNPVEAVRLGDPKYRDAIADAIAHGIVRFVMEREAIARRLVDKDDGTLASVR
ncbi:N-acetylmuramoyl-L-alanine amidase [Myxococcota bacterium]|nr:N-acetylmuramoyl-L-alanine amidase [Myxococcota bacterium]